MADPYPGQHALLERGSSPDWIDRHYLRIDPFAFMGERDAFLDFRCDLASRLDVFPNGIFCTGSGAVGLSLNPNKVSSGLLKRYDHDSDLDIAVISEVYFEQAWRDLREIGHSVFAPKPSRNLEKRLEHQRNRMFDGAIIASKLLSRLSFGSKWSTQLLAAKLQVGDLLQQPREMNIWIYRDYWSVRGYVAEGIAKCADKIRMQDGN